MRNLRAAITLLTRIPVPSSGDVGVQRAVPWFPVAGALVGAIVGAVAAGLLHVVPSIVAATVAVLVGVLLTGAFHEDGLADVADAFAGGWTPAERMRILEDPLHGSYGVAALCGSIIIRVACVASFGVSPAVAFGCLVAAHALARSSAVVLMITTPVARPDGLGATYAASVRRGAAALGALSGVAVGAVAVGWWIGPMVLTAIVSVAIVRWLSMGKLGGITGDVLGTVEQVAECLILVVASGLASRHGLWWPR